MEPLDKKSISLMLRLDTEANRMFLRLVADEPIAQGILVAGKRLHKLGVDFYATLVELVAIGHKLGAPESLKDWTFLGNNTWKYQLLADDAPHDLMPSGDEDHLAS